MKILFENKPLYHDKSKAWRDGWFCGMFEKRSYSDKNMYRRVLRRLNKYSEISGKNTIQAKIAGMQFMEGRQQGIKDWEYLKRAFKKHEIKPRG